MIRNPNLQPLNHETSGRILFSFFFLILKIVTSTHRPGEKPWKIPIQMTIIFSSFSWLSPSETQKNCLPRLAIDARDGTWLIGHRSKYWLHPKLLDPRERQSHTPTAHLSLSVIFLNNIYNKCYIFILIYFRRSKIFSFISFLKLSNSLLYALKYRRLNSTKLVEIITT